MNLKMKTRYFFVVALAVGLFLAPASQASTATPLLNQNSYSVGHGDIELDTSMNLGIFRGDLSDERFHLRLGGNYFLTDMFAPGVETEILDQGAGTDFRLLPNIKVYWPTYHRLLPFAFAGVGYANLGTADLFNVAMGLGIRYLLSSSVAIGAMFRYDLGTGDGTIHQIQFPIGFSIYFRL